MRRWTVFWVVVAWVSVGIHRSGVAEAPPAAAETDPGPELNRLRAENIALRDVIRAMDEEVEQRTRMLAEARAEADLLRARAEGKRKREPVGTGRLNPAVLEDMRVISVDRDHDVVAISGGAEQNLRVGMTGVIVRKNKVIATVRLDEVRPRVTGAVIVKQPGRHFPEAGDRLVLGTMEER